MNILGKVKKLSLKQVHKDLRNKVRTNVAICFDNDVNIRDSPLSNKAKLIEGGFGWYRVMVSIVTHNSSAISVFICIFYQSS